MSAKKNKNKNYQNITADVKVGPWGRFQKDFLMLIVTPQHFSIFHLSILKHQNMFMKLKNRFWCLEHHFWC